MGNKKARTQRILNLFKKGEILSVNQIFRKTGIAKPTILNTINDLLVSRKVVKVIEDLHNGYILSSSDN